MANMRKYIAFLRGINISGKNKVPMVELKKGLRKSDLLVFQPKRLSENKLVAQDGKCKNQQ